jgi:hypothetical protein
MNSNTVSTCSTYDWCDGQHDADMTLTHRDDRILKFDFEVESSSSPWMRNAAWVEARHERLEGSEDEIFVDLDRGTATVSYDGFPAYLKQLRAFVDQLETYYPLTLTAVK